MMRLLFLIATTAILSSCGIYRKYPRATDVVSEDLYGDIKLSEDSVSMAMMSWQEIFVDEKLRCLIEQGLDNNTDIRIAKLRIGQTEVSLKAARLAFLPSLSVTPQGSSSQFGSNATSYTYSLPLTASWQIDIFGRLRNAKERAKVAVESSYAYQKAVQSELIATIALQYYTLAMLREQEQVVEKSAELWSETIRTMRLLMEAGQYNDAAVSQAEASYNSVLGANLDIKQQINEVENSLSVLLGDAVHSVETNSLSNWQNPQALQVGIPLQLLSMRPDVIQAELALASAFYATAEARSEFYPSLTLGGSVGWSNVAGVVTSPGKFLWDALASLTQPIFANGRLKAQYRIAQSEQEEAKLNFQQTVLNAGAEVNTSYLQIQTYAQKTKLCKNQVTALQRSIKATKLLMEGGSSNYLEVLTAQDALLAARLAFISNQYNEISSYISLYQALGGG